MSERIAIYPGSFDPITFGHLDIVRRAVRCFDHVRVAVAFNKDKPSGLFTPEERVAMLEEVTAEHGDHVTVDSFYGLLTDYAARVGATTIIRGLRAVADFDYEFQMALMNRHLASDLETVFLMADNEYLYTSASLVKEVAHFGGDVSGHVPETVAMKLAEKMKERK